MRPLDGIEENVLKIYNEIETELLENITKTMYDFSDDLENAPGMWRLRMMDKLGILNKRALDIIAEKALLTNVEVAKMLNKAGIIEAKEGEELLEELKEHGHLIYEDQISPNEGKMANIVK